jgi:adenine C2-methylase RlmN of 23S rRNA A2503 and tRNA A37
MKAGKVSPVIVKTIFLRFSRGILLVRSRVGCILGCQSCTAIQNQNDYDKYEFNGFHKV